MSRKSIFVPVNFNAAEDTFLKVKKSLNCRGRILDLSTPALMGVLNFTPDSFYDGGKFNNEKSILKTVESMLQNGADIFDIGGQSTRPGAKKISADEEWERIHQPLNYITKTFPDAIISIDTFYSDVARKSIEEGASIINDISAWSIDKKMFDFITEKKIPYVLMHMKGTPENMQENPKYDDVVMDVMNFFKEKIKLLRDAGLNDILIDPGFGFGKNLDDNYRLLKNLSMFRMFEQPVLAGISRKSMVTKLLGIKTEDALTGTIALNTIALVKGASVIRVHDVVEADQVMKIVTQLGKM